MSPRRTRKSWRRLVAEAERIGSVAKTAGRHGVKAKTLAWWRWNLRGEASTRKRARLLPVVLPPTAQAVAVTAFPIEITVRDVTFRVCAQSDVGYVAALVAAVRSAC